MDAGEDSSALAFCLMCWSSVVDVGRLPDRHGCLWKDVCSSDGAAAKTACLQPAPARVLFIIWPKDVVVILFSARVLCTMYESSI